MDNYDYFYTKEITTYEIDYNIAASFADIIADDLIEIRDAFNGVEGDDIPQIIADLNAQISRLQKITADFYKQVEDSKNRAQNSNRCYQHYLKTHEIDGVYCDPIDIDSDGLIYGCYYYKEPEPEPTLGDQILSIFISTARAETLGELRYKKVSKETMFNYK